MAELMFGVKQLEGRHISCDKSRAKDKWSKITTEKGDMSS